MFSEKGCNQVVAGVGPGVGELGEGIGVGWVRRVWIEKRDRLGVHVAGDDYDCMVGHLAEKGILDALDGCVTQEFATIHSYNDIVTLLQSRGYILQLAIIALNDR